jgi:hypothetical protein
MPRLPGSTLRILAPVSSKNDHGKKLAFAETVDAGQTEALGAQIAETLSTSPPAEPSTLEPIVVPEIDATPIELDATPIELNSTPLAFNAPPLESLHVPDTTTPDDSRDSWRPSLVGRLRAPTRWRSKTWIGVWVLLTGALAVLILKPPAKRNDTAQSSKKVEATSALAARPVEPTPRPPVDAVQPMPAVAPPPAPTSVPPVPASMGYLTVHSRSPYAVVYVGLRRSGHVDQKLPVRCGERFVAIGLPRGIGREPIWLAPGTTIDVPCDGSLDVTMNPRRLRPKRHHHENRHVTPNRPRH